MITQQKPKIGSSKLPLPPPPTSAPLVSRFSLVSDYDKEYETRENKKNQTKENLKQIIYSTHTLMLASQLPCALNMIPNLR